MLYVAPDRLLTPRCCLSHARPRPTSATVRDRRKGRHASRNGGATIFGAPEIISGLSVGSGAERFHRDVAGGIALKTGQPRRTLTGRQGRIVGAAMLAGRRRLWLRRVLDRPNNAMRSSTRRNSIYEIRASFIAERHGRRTPAFGLFCLSAGQRSKGCRRQQLSKGRIKWPPWPYHAGPRWGGRNMARPATRTPLHQTEDGLVGV